MCCWLVDRYLFYFTLGDKPFGNEYMWVYSKNGNCCSGFEAEMGKVVASFTEGRVLPSARVLGGASIWDAVTSQSNG